MATNAVSPEEYAAGLGRFKAMLAAAGSVVPNANVEEWYGILVNGQQIYCDSENAEAARLYLLGSPLMPTADGSYGRWQGWFNSDYAHANTEAKKEESLLRLPPPPCTKVVDVALDWPDRVFSTIPVCPQPKVPTATVGIFIGAALGGGCYSIATQEDRNRANGLRVNYNGVALQLRIYPLGGWWEPAPAGTSVVGLPVATAAAPIPTGGE